MEAFNLLGKYESKIPLIYNLLSAILCIAKEKWSEQYIARHLISKAMLIKNLATYSKDSIFKIQVVQVVTCELLA